MAYTYKLILSLLFLLISAAGIHAQCTISDVTATVGNCNDDEFIDVVLDFNYDQVSDSFYLRGNGLLYGLYTYAEIPITLSVESDCITPYEFVIIDQGNPDCSDFVELGEICCNSDCRILDLEVNIQCNNDGFYQATLSFDNRNTSDFFELRGNGNNYGIFEYADQPITIGNLVSDCETVLEFVMIDSENPDCRADTELGIVCCDSTQLCTITDLQVYDIECLNNGNYNFVLNFNYGNADNDFYDLWVNNEFIGFYSLSNLPQSIENITERPNTMYDIVRICINDNSDCCGTIEYQQQNCDNQDCSIRDLVVEFTECDSTGLFSAYVNFNYRQVSDSFNVRGNGNYYGSYLYDDLPIMIYGLNEDCETVYEFIITDSENNNCQADIDAGTMCCDENNCEILSIDALTECRENGNYNLEIDFDVINPGNDFYEVWINNNFIGFYPLSDRPHIFSNITPRPNSLYDIVRICINDQPDCCQVIEYIQPNCDSTLCPISDLIVELSECDNSDHFSAEINFNSNDADTPFHIYTNNAYYGSYEPVDLPVHINDLETNCNTPLIFTVAYDSLSYNCQESYVIEEFCCSTECQILDFEISHVQCYDNGTESFTAVLTFDHINTSQTFELLGNGNNYGTFAYANEPIIIENLEADCATTLEFVMVDSDNPDCRADAEWGIVCCDSTMICGVSDLLVTEIDCNNDGTYNFILDFSYNNPNNEFYDIWVNNVFTGFYSLTDLPQIIENITERPATNYDIVRICINDNPDCCSVLEYEQENCSIEECSITDLVVEFTECGDSTGTFSAFIDFNSSSMSNNFEVRGNGNNYGTFTYSSLPITIDGLNEDCETVYEFVIIDSEHSSCQAAINAGTMCCDENNCEISDLETFTECRNDGNYDLAINFDVINPDNEFYDIWINNEYKGSYLLIDLPQTFQNISERENSDYDIVRVCINDHPDCCHEVEYMAPECFAPADHDFRITVMGDQVEVRQSTQSSGDYEITIYNYLGELQWTRSTSQTIFMVDLNPIANGLYIIQANDETQRLSKMIWVNH